MTMTTKNARPSTIKKHSGLRVKRLFNEFQPLHYILELKPDGEHMTFSGSVIISGQKVGRPSKRITLHQNGLSITKVRITRHTNDGDQPVKVSRINLHKSLNEVRLHADELIYPGRYTISLDFAGKITRPMNGIYPCFFKYKGKDRQLIATQFESHHAREVFPCIDEPEAKSTFDLTLTTPAHEQVISNTTVKTQQTKDKLTTTSFETTPRMSTYLLGFVYGQLGFREAKTKRGVVVRAYATPDNVAITDFALQTAVKCLDFYSDYFDIDYPLAKCDLIALPDFAAGAMENWGCITFREQALLVDPKLTSLANQQYVALVVAHELAHQWFGNLVTMQWWTDLWLNEGFASWIEYLAIDQLFPKWQMWTQFIVDEQQQALKLDALEYTHPIEVPVRHPDEIRTIFDAVSYSKGASVIHMLNNYLGNDVFKTGLRYYLKKHAYGSTTTKDLWAALEEVSHKPVSQFMDAWTTLSGFPIVSANVNSHEVELHQERFFTNPEHSKLAAEKWPVALLSKTPGVPDLFTETRLSATLPDGHNFKLNQGQSGFYRVIYNSSHLEELGSLIKRGRLSSLDRLGVLADLVEAAKAGKADTVDTLHFLKNFKSESDYAVWDVIASLVGSLRLTMDDEALREQMKPFIRTLVGEQLGRLGWERKSVDSHFDRLLRPIILGMAASADEPSVVRRCRDLFASIEHAEDLAPELGDVPSKSRVKRGADVDPDLRGTVYGTAARLGGEAEFDKLLQLHNSASLSEERVTLSAAITGFRQPELVKRALGLITSDTVRLQDVPYWIAYSFLNRHAKQQTWQWMQQNWDWLHQHMGSDLSFYRLPIYSARSSSDIKFLEAYKKFFTSVMSKSLERSYRQGIEMIEWQSSWKHHALAETKIFFEAYSSTGKK